MYLNTVTSQKDIMRHRALMSATARPGITGLRPVNTLSLERVYHLLQEAGRGNLLCLLCKCTVNRDIFIKKQTNSLAQPQQRTSI